MKSEQAEKQRDVKQKEPSLPFQFSLLSSPPPSRGHGDCNIRTIASTSGRIVGVAKNGTIMDYGGQTAANGWLLISGDAGSGWVSNKYGHLI